MRIAKRSAVGLAVFGGAAWVGLFLTPAIGRAGQAEKALPPTTFLYLKVDNAAKLRQTFKTSQIGRLIADPALDPLKQDIIAKLEEPGKKVKEALGVSIADLLTLPQGTITIAVVAKDQGEGKAPAANLLASADAGENADKMNDVMGRATKEAENQGAKVATESFKDTKLTIVRKNEDDKEPLVWAKVGSTFHIASDVDALKDLLSNASGRAESLASNENYQGVLKGIGEDAHVQLFVDVTQLLDLAIASNPGGNAAQLKAQLQLFGVNSFKGVGASFSFDKGEYDQVTKVFLYSPGPAQGVFKIFGMPAVDLKPQAWVPASILSYQSISWDLDGAWKAITDLLEANNYGALVEQAQNGIGPNGDFKFKEDVFGPLGNRITAIGDLKKPITEKSQRALFAVALDDEKAFANTFNKLVGITQASPKKRDFQGTTIYDFEIPPAAAQMNLEGPISVAIAKGNMFISTEPTLLEQILRSGAPALADSADYQAVAKKLPAKNSVLSFDRTEEQARALYEMFKGEGFQKALDQAAANNGGQKIKSPIDPAKIPDFSVFAKYLGQGGSYGLQDEQGVTFTSFVLKKEAP